MEKVVGILGGMGPLATVDLFQKIVSQTEAKSDRDHIHIIIDNNTEVPDRTDAIIGPGESPITYLITSAIKLEMMGADVLIMPCNSAHHFLDDITPFIEIPFINMIEETVQEIKKNHKGSKVGVLSTGGTNKSGIYDTVLKGQGIDFIKSNEEQQRTVTDVIYAVKKGDTHYGKTDLLRVLKQMRDDGADVFILGCTELPIAFHHMHISEPNIDPTDILARRTIEFVGKRVVGAGA